MTGRDRWAMLATLTFAFWGPLDPAGAGGLGSVAVDVTPRPLDWIAPGTLIADTAPKGWTDFLLLATPRIGVGKVEDVPRAAVSYSSMFHFAMVAKVRESAPAGFELEKVGIGLALKIDGRTLVADSENTLGADLGLIGRTVMAENEKVLRDEFRQVARTATMLVFDARVFVLRGGKHQSMVIRHVVLTVPTTGKVSTFVWLLGQDGDRRYFLAEKGLQKLPTGLLEDRVLSVDPEKFTFGIPSSDAFALTKIPQGTSLGFSEALKAVAATTVFTPDLAQRLEAELQIRYAPVVARSKPGLPIRR